MMPAKTIAASVITVACRATMLADAIIAAQATVCGAFIPVITSHRTDQQERLTAA